jgi:L,D-transpeptidase YcbB
MKRSQILGVLVVAVLAAGAAVLWGRGAGSAKRAPAQAAASALPALAPQQLSADSQAALRAIIEAGNLPDLRWPNFSDYGKHLAKFYEAYGYSLPWVRGMAPTAQAQQAIEVLRKAEEKGLAAEDYDGPRWSERIAKLKPAAAAPSEADAVRFDAALTICVMRYISDLHIGKVNPKHFAFGLDVQEKKYDLPQFVKENVVDAPNVVAALGKAEPPYPGYRRTIQALERYLEIAKESTREPFSLPVGKKVLAPGDAYAGVAQLVQRLRQVGDLPADANVPPDAAKYEGPLVDAVKKFQQRHGRTADGRIDAQTLADLNVPISSRIRQMQLTLERWRWLPPSYAQASIIANIPEFRLRAYDENFKIGVTMEVVVGKAYHGHNTPVFSDMMEYVVFRPYWSVPYGIAKGEYFPKLERDPDYLAKKGFEVVNNKQEVVVSGAISSDVLDQLRAGKLFLRQKSGPDDALGLVKFIFPNDYSVYMHDSPEHELFSRDRRDFSHGCIRLERPADLAVWVLRNNPGWNADRVRAAMQSGPPGQQVNLAHPIPVLILYATVIVSEDGVVHFYDDIYGHDAALEKVLEKGYPYPG